MAEWFEVKVKFLRQTDNGLIKQVREQYLVDSLSFTEAEGRVMLEVGECMREVTVQAVTRTKIQEVVFYGDTDCWFKCKVTYSTLDEETEKEKKITTYLLVNANDAKEAIERTEDHLKNMLVPFQIPKVEESPIVEVFQHVAGIRPGLRRMEKQPESEDSLRGKTTDSDAPEKIGFKIPAKPNPHIPDDYLDGIKTLPESLQDEFKKPIDPTDGQAHDFATDIEDEDDDEPTDLEGRLDKAFAKADGKPSIGLIDAVNEFFGGNLEARQAERIIEQHRTLPENEFRTWVNIAHELDADDCHYLSKLIREG